MIDNIKHGKGDVWKDYYRRYDYYLGNQQRLFGADWQTPTDVIGEARHYGLFGPQTLGAHTALLEQNQSPLEALEMKIEIPALERPRRS
jgi:NADH-quinone oxidoreductase subunit B